MLPTRYMTDKWLLIKCKQQWMSFSLLSDELMFIPVKEIWDTRKQRIASHDTEPLPLLGNVKQV